MVQIRVYFECLKIFPFFRKQSLDLFPNGKTLAKKNAKRPGRKEGHWSGDANGQLSMAEVLCVRAAQYVTDCGQPILT